MDSIREQLFQTIEAQVRAIAGVGDVVRGKLDALEIQRYPAVSIFPRNDTVTEYMGDQIDRDMGVGLFTWVKAQVNIHKALEAWLPLIQKKMAEDNTLGGKAIDCTETDVSEPFPLNDEITEAGVIIDYTVRYRVRRDNPYLQF